MGRNKDDFIKATGGFRFGEPPEAFKKRVEKIQTLETLFKSGTLDFDELELVQRQICELKGIDFDGPDDD